LSTVYPVGKTELTLYKLILSPESGENTNNVTLEGNVISMGPRMGCWLILDDGTGKVTLLKVLYYFS
jgi:hypothetical protein